MPGLTGMRPCPGEWPARQPSPGSSVEPHSKHKFCSYVWRIAARRIRWIARRWISSRYVGRVCARNANRLFRDPNPSSQVRHAHKPARKEKTHGGENAHRGDIPSIGLGHADAHTRNITASDRPYQRPARRRRRCRHNRSTIRAKPRARRKRRSTTLTVELHDKPSRITLSDSKISLRKNACPGSRRRSSDR